MSRAFVKEDVDLLERVGRVRTPSGLPPGALNYMTLSGARRIQQRLAELKGKPFSRDPGEGNARRLDDPNDAGSG